MRELEIEFLEEYKALDILLKDVLSSDTGVTGYINKMSESYGQASRIYNVVFVLLALVLARKYSGAGTVVSALMIGFLIDIIYSLWSSIVVDAGFVVSLLVFLIGLVIYALGIAVLIRCDAGMNCLDALLYRLMDVTNFKYRYLRIAADIILTLSGCLMGGVFGLGTVLSVLLTGPLAGFFAGVKK